MVDSIINDIKSTFSSGNMISKIILVNVALFVLINLIYVFNFGIGDEGNSLFAIVRDGLAIPSDPLQFIKQPWSLITHFFLHVGFWHLVWNMLMLYWFGRIVGDLIGDERVLPIYLMSGIFGGLVFMCHDLFLPGGTAGMATALGASAAVMAIVWSSAMISPDYTIHLLFLGPVKLKYIALALLFMDIIGSAGDMNKGGHFAHLGGAAWGMAFVYFLRKGTDITEPLVKLFASTKNQKPKIKKTPRNKFKVVHRTSQTDSDRPPGEAYSQQDRLDKILDKINELGFDKLDDEEKDFLYKASKEK